MNYLTLITQFWKLRRTRKITSTQADLYLFLVNECNEQHWQIPFAYSNKLICASIGISEPTLIDASNRLKQYGLIDFTGGRRNESTPQYTILYLNNFSKSRATAVVKDVTDTPQTPPPLETNQTKPNNAIARARPLPEEYLMLDKQVEILQAYIANAHPAYAEPYADLWNLCAQEAGLPQVLELTYKRRSRLALRLKEPQFDYTALLARIAGSDFIRSGSWCSFDYIIDKRDNYLRILEGHYDNRKETTNPHHHHEPTLSAAAAELQRRIGHKGQQP